MKTYIYKPLVVLILVLRGALAQAQDAWLTLVGNLGDAESDIVDIQPQSLRSSSGFVNYLVRVNRAKLRCSWDDIPYRAYTASVVIDCSAQKGRYASMAFHMVPLWAGKPHKTHALSASEERPMLIRSIEPNPTDRIIRLLVVAGPLTEPLIQFQVASALACPASTLHGVMLS